MTGYRIRFTREAASLFSSLHPEIKRLLKSELEMLSRTPFGGTTLQGELSGFMSWRFRRYRIIYRIDEEENALSVIHVGHRRDVYEQFRKLLDRLSE